MYEALQQGCEKEYNLKKIYNIYVKIAQAHIIYQPSKANAIIAMPFDWLEVQNLLEDYLEKHKADFDALCKEYISESAEDGYLPSAQPESQWIPVTKEQILQAGYEGRDVRFHIGGRLFVIRELAQ